MRQSLADALGRLVDIALVEPPMQVIVEAPQGGGQFAAQTQVQGVVQVVNDLLRADDVVVDRYVEFQRVSVLKTTQSPFEEADRSVVKLEYQQPRRRRLGGDLLVRPQRILFNHTRRPKAVPSEHS